MFFYFRTIRATTSFGSLVFPFGTTFCHCISCCSLSFHFCFCFFLETCGGGGCFSVIFDPAFDHRVCTLCQTRRVSKFIKKHKF